MDRSKVNLTATTMYTWNIRLKTWERLNQQKGQPSNKEMLVDAFKNNCTFFTVNNCQTIAVFVNGFYAFLVFTVYKGSYAYLIVFLGVKGCRHWALTSAEIFRAGTVTLIGHLGVDAWARTQQQTLWFISRSSCPKLSGMGVQSPLFHWNCLKLYIALLF